MSVNSCLLSTDYRLFCVVYLKDLEVFTTKPTEQSNVQPTSVLAAAAVLAHSPTTTTAATPTSTASVKPLEQHPQQTQQQPQHEAAVVALAHNTEQSLASTKEKSTPEKVSERFIFQC